MIYDVPLSCPAAQQILIISHQSKQNQAESVTAKIKVNPTQLSEQKDHPLLLENWVTVLHPCKMLVREKTPPLMRLTKTSTKSCGRQSLTRMARSEKLSPDPASSSRNLCFSMRRPGECSTVPFRISVCHFNLQIKMQIGAPMRRTVIPHLKLILKTYKLKIEMQIEMKWYIVLSVQQLRQIATLTHKLR